MLSVRPRIMALLSVVAVVSVAAGTPAVAAPVSDPSWPVGKDAAWTSGIHAVDATRRY
jgi:hypothetical protein